MYRNAMDEVARRLKSPVNHFLICGEFEVQPEEALRDAEALAEDLAKHGILRISEEPIAEHTRSQQPAAAPGKPMPETR